MNLYKALLSDRAILRLSGPDTRPLLQGLVTQDMEKITTATASYGCLLTPQGKFLTDFFLIQIGEDIFLDCDDSLGEMLFKKLHLYKLRANVEIEDVSSDWGTGLLWGDMEHGPAGQMMGLGSGSSRAVAYTDPRLPALGLRILAPRDDLDSALDHFDCPMADLATYDMHRLTLGVPVCGKDILSEQTFPLDCNLDALNSVDYSKGCFVGQEVASRMKRKGEIRKRIWMAQFDGKVPQRGAALTASDQTIGEVSSVAGQTALIRVRLDRLAKAGDPSVAMAGETKLRLMRPAYLEICKK